MLSVLFITNTSLKSQWPYEMLMPTHPSHYFILDAAGVGRNLIPPPLSVPLNLNTTPKLLIHSTDPITHNGFTKAILRIQDVNTENFMFAGSPEIQFWSNHYQTPNQWIGGKIQMVTNTNNIAIGPLIPANGVTGGLGFFSKQLSPINSIPQSLVETMRVIDNKVGIGTNNTQPLFRFNVSPKIYSDPNQEVTELFAVDYAGSDNRNDMLLRLYNRTGLNPLPNGKLPTYAWQIELPRSNTSTNDAPYGALNFCSSTATVGVGEEVVNRLVTFTRDGKVGINNPQPQEALHVLGKARINKTGTGNNKAPINVHSNYQLAVEGKLVAEEIIVTLDNWWPDYVFEENYNLPTLNEVETHIKVNKHLPGIPTANEVKTNGANIGEVQVKLLQKIEELTLYLIEQDKKIQELQNQINNK